MEHTYTYLIYIHTYTPVIQYINANEFYTYNYIARAPRSCVSQKPMGARALKVFVWVRLISQQRLCAATQPAARSVDVFIM